MTSLAQPFKHAIAAEVIGFFNDGARGEKPVQRRSDGLLGPRSVAWRVHGDVASMMIGGVAALLLQTLHPAVLAGVWDHSNFRSDMQGRLRRTARFIALTTYGAKGEAEAAIAHVRAIHEHVHGTLPDGTPYFANDPALLAWVHVTETTCFLNGWMRYAQPAMPRGDQDRYFAEMAPIARALGASPVPHSRSEARRIIDSMRPSLGCTARTREIARLLVDARPPQKMSAPIHRLAVQASIDLLPDWAQRMHGLHTPAFGLPLVRAGMFGVARTLRWAFN